MQNDKWLMFKNYMHNELGVNKEDIRTWLDDAIQIEAKKLVENTFKDFSINALIKDLIFKHNGYSFQKNVETEVIKILKDNLKIDISLNKKD